MMFLAFGIGAESTRAQEAAPNSQDVDLRDLSLKRILDLDVTSVSKRSQKLQDVATSIYVINEEDIRRSGATRIQDVLKLAPGTWFSDASYTMSTSGVREGAFVFNNTLLWIIDGVPIVNQVMGGVSFEVLDLPLGDIERIEVIKGPGGTIYGANAASGIISIFTKSGEKAEGLKASMEGGTQNYLAPFVRYGWEANENLFLSVWGKYKTHDGYDRNPLFSGDSLMAPVNGGGDVKVKNRFTGRDDYQQALEGGLKWDFQPSDSWKWSGGLTQNRITSGQYSLKLFPYATTPQNPPKRPDSVFANEESLDETILRARVDHSFGEDNAFFVNAYHWRYRFNLAIGDGFLLGYDASEVEAQENSKWLGWNRVSAGANLRRVQYDMGGLNDDGSVFFANPKTTAYLLGEFVQDEMSLGDRWRLTAGAKAESWSLISLVPEISPSLRLAFNPSPEMTWWAAASRSITTPSYSQFDGELRVAQVPPAWFLNAVPGAPQNAPAAGKWVAIVPGNDFKPVDYYTLEIGHRGSHALKVQWDISAFYSWVRNEGMLTPVDSTLQTVIASPHQPDSLTPLYNANLDNTQHFGGEAVFRFFPQDYLRLELSYSLFYIWQFEGLPIPGDTLGRTFQNAHELRTPRHVGRVKAYVDLPWDIALTVNGILSSPYSRGEAFNYVSQTPASQSINPSLALVADPPRVQLQLDVCLQKTLWRDQLSLSIWGRNLLESPFVEVYNQYAWVNYPHQVHRTFGAGLVYQY